VHKTAESFQKISNLLLKVFYRLIGHRRQAAV
jgi:hypothetical protein